MSRSYCNFFSPIESKTQHSFRIIRLMAIVRAHAGSSLLAVIDVQQRLVPYIHDAERVLARCAFLIRAAALLDVPIVATTQNAARMGAIDPSLQEALPPDSQIVDKMTFSCCGVHDFQAQLEAASRRQIILLGIETHICVSQTAHDLLTMGYEVIVCPDAVGARSPDRYKIGMERIRDAGCAPAHTEAVAYEWIQAADDARFKQFLELVKAHA